MHPVALISHTLRQGSPPCGLRITSCEAVPQEAPKSKDRPAWGDVGPARGLRPGQETQPVTGVSMCSGSRDQLSCGASPRPRAAGAPSEMGSEQGTHGHGPRPRPGCLLGGVLSPPSSRAGVWLGETPARLQAFHRLVALGACIVGLQRWLAAPAGAWGSREGAASALSRDLPIRPLPRAAFPPTLGRPAPPPAP